MILGDAISDVCMDSVCRDFEPYFKVHSLVSVHHISIIHGQMTNLNMIIHVLLSRPSSLQYDKSHSQNNLTISNKNILFENMDGYKTSSLQFDLTKFKASNGHGSMPGLTSQTDLHHSKSL